MGYLIALASAALYGAADFVGGMATRRTNTIAAVLISQFSGLVLLTIILLVSSGLSIQAERGDLVWGGAAGMAGGIGVALLYRALAIGTMAIVAPITAVCAVAIPVMVAILLGERPPAIAQAGIVLALASIVLVSQQGGAPGVRGLGAGVPLALMSGVAIGVFFLCLARTRPEAGLWPLVAARSASVAFFAAVALATRRSMRMPAVALAMVVGCGALDMLANMLYLIATRHGPLSIIVTLSSLYPASTVVLARVILGERLSAVQGAGIACAFVAVVMIVGS